MEELFDRVFHLKENHTDARTEIIAGITTFMTMAYILIVNPSILSATGMDKGALVTTTALASALGTLFMAVFANYPFALAPGMGLNAYFAYTVVLQMGYTWQVALAAVFVEGLVFILLSLTNIREAIFNAIPLTLKRAISVGIGLFIAFIGLLNAKIVVANPATKVSLYSFTKAVADGTFHSVGITVVIALIGILFTGFLIIKNIRGNILFGILGTWILGMIAEASGLYIPDPKLGTFSVFPNLSAGLAAFIPLNPLPVWGKMDFSSVFSLDFFAVIFAFLFVDLFDTLGTLIGVASKSNMLDEKGRLPHIKGALMADSVATCTGALMGTSTVTTFVESADFIASLLTFLLRFTVYFLGLGPRAIPPCVHCGLLVEP